MFGLYDVWPFNIASGPEFLAFYFFISLVGLIGAGAGADRRRLADRSAAPKPSPAEPRRRARARCPTGSGAPERAAPPPTPAHGRAGCRGRDELWEIAYLKEGTRGVANALIGAALAADWLQPTEDGQIALAVAEAPTDLTLGMLHKRLCAIAGPKLTVDQARAAATATAEAVEAYLVGHLHAAGMLRAPAAISRLRRIVWVTGALLMARRHPPRGPRDLARPLGEGLPSWWR